MNGLLCSIVTVQYSIDCPLLYLLKPLLMDIEIISDHLFCKLQWITLHIHHFVWVHMYHRINS